MMKRRNQRSSELFIGGDVVSKSDAIGKVSQSSEYEAAMAAAALMERPPEESAMKSVEATNNLVATALLMKFPNRTSTRKDSSNMIASALAKRQGSASKWHQSLGVAVQTNELGLQSNQPGVTQDHREPTRTDIDREKKDAIIEVQPINAAPQMETGLLENGPIKHDEISGSADQETQLQLTNEAQAKQQTEGNNEDEANGLGGQQSRTQATHTIPLAVGTSTPTAQDQARQQELAPQSIVGQGQQGRLRARN
jgi:hypothetical protein